MAAATTLADMDPTMEGRRGSNGELCAGLAGVRGNTCVSSAGEAAGAGAAAALAAAGLAASLARLVGRLSEKCRPIILPADDASEEVGEAAEVGDAAADGDDEAATGLAAAVVAASPDCACKSFTGVEEMRADIGSGCCGCSGLLTAGAAVAASAPDGNVPFSCVARLTLNRLDGDGLVLSSDGSAITKLDDAAAVLLGSSLAAACSRASIVSIETDTGGKLSVSTPDAEGASAAAADGDESSAAATAS